ncbi:oxygen-independent coproporphyrinogen-3 oxidase [Microbulbifer hydrolyticus]|uniref:Heme chaperone HemW n=1 Tax=Microbulbifer hydrolyticus TaxID=48074 RepID=A0AA89TM76_9GAMM|nr:radical SAM family heme chaperone HemW [Microbulbifer hydrolyticus]MBB5211946.1 oxygen-independent coproporphyrinogen-3 oxidase [Microbulbifer hydrolyticus]
MSQDFPALKLPPLSLYVHIPWCVRKCPYCDFNSHEVATGAIAVAAGAHVDIRHASQTERADAQLPEAEYVDQLERDLRSQLGWVQGRKLGSIFFGGGTPSLFSPLAIERILNLAESLVGFEPGIEITLEANPGTFEQAKFAGYRSAGVNRLSIGVQSFDPLQLQNLGRIHSGPEAETAATEARQAGFDNINIDLMHGLPGQGEIDALRDLRRAVALGAEHISWYQLTIEPNTAFYSAPPVTPGSEQIAAIQRAGRAYLAGEGYGRYEVSAYARADLASRHNLNYWSFADYIGIGAGAHGKFTLPGSGRIIRTQRTRTPRDYLALGCALGEGGLEFPLPKVTDVAPSERPLEFLMNTLRLATGVPADTFPAYTGLPLSALERPWSRLQAMELVEPLGPSIATTAFGYDYVDEVLQRFLPED